MCLALVLLPFSGAMQCASDVRFRAYSSETTCAHKKKPFCFPETYFLHSTEQPIFLGSFLCCVVRMSYQVISLLRCQHLISQYHWLWKAIYHIHTQRRQGHLQHYSEGVECTETSRYANEARKSLEGYKSLVRKQTRSKETLMARLEFIPRLVRVSNELADKISKIQAELNRKVWSKTHANCQSTRHTESKALSSCIHEESLIISWNPWTFSVADSLLCGCQ